MTTDPAHVLVVLCETAVTPGLLDAVAERAAGGPCWFRVLVPTALGRHGAADSRRVLDDAVARVEEAAHRPADGELSPRHDAMDAIEEALLGDAFDEIILSMRPHRLTSALHVDLPRRVAHLGLPLRTVLVEG